MAPNRSVRAEGPRPPHLSSLGSRIAGPPLNSDPLYGMRIVSTALLVILVLSMPARAETDAQSRAPEISAAVRSVVSGGGWVEGDVRGFYRVILESEGFEHVSSRLWLEWLVEQSREDPAMVVARTLVTELSQGFLSLGLENAEEELLSSRLRVSGANPYSLDEQAFEIELGGPGVYRVVRHAVLKSGTGSDSH